MTDDTAQEVTARGGSPSTSQNTQEARADLPFPATERDSTLSSRHLSM